MPHSPTKTTGLQKSFGLDIRRVYREYLERIYHTLSSTGEGEAKFLFTTAKLKVVALLIDRISFVLGPINDAYIQLTWDKAITWVKEFALAKSMEAAARIRGKFKGGDINMETDADEMIGTVQTMLADLDDKLTNMQLVEVE